MIKIIKNDDCRTNLFVGAWIGVELKKNGSRWWRRRTVDAGWIFYPRDPAWSEGDVLGLGELSPDVKHEDGRDEEQRHHEHWNWATKIEPKSVACCTTMIEPLTLWFRGCRQCRIATFLRIQLRFCLSEAPSLSSWFFFAWDFHLSWERFRRRVVQPTSSRLTLMMLVLQADRRELS